jgi:hypothetical protein
MLRGEAAGWYWRAVLTLGVLAALGALALLSGGLF